MCLSACIYAFLHACPIFLSPLSPQLPTLSPFLSRDSGWRRELRRGSGGGGEAGAAAAASADRPRLDKTRRIRRGRRLTVSHCGAQSRCGAESQRLHGSAESHPPQGQTAQILPPTVPARRLSPSPPPNRCRRRAAAAATTTRRCWGQSGRVLAPPRRASPFGATAAAFASLRRRRPQPSTEFSFLRRRRRSLCRRWARATRGGASCYARQKESHDDCLVEAQIRRGSQRAHSAPF